MAAPTFSEVLDAFLTIERYIVAKAAELRAKFPDSVQMIDRAVSFLQSKEAPLAALKATVEELRVFLPEGKGPVTHDPVDTA
jgi:hypothetical protein